MKTILYQPLFINPQAYFVFPQLYHIEKGDSYIEPANITGQLIINDLTKVLTSTPTLNVVQDTNQVDFGLFKGKHIRISQYTNIGAVVLGEWYIPGTPTPPEPEQPDWFKESIVAWYSPYCKQRMTNYDVIEAYAEDFSKKPWNNKTEKYVGNLTSKALTVTEVLVRSALIYTNIKPYNFKVRITGLINNQKVIFGDDTSTYRALIVDKDGIYDINWEDNHRAYCIWIDFIGECNITITQLPTSILKDFSGNGNHAYLYGGKGKLNSGMGLYKIDFTTYINKNNILDVKPNSFITNAGASYINSYYNQIANNIPTYNIKVANLNGSIKYSYKDTDYTDLSVIIEKDGTYNLPISYKVNENKPTGFSINSSTKVTITQIPDYPDQLCYDGKMYAVAYDMPILTDYTIIADRTWFDKTNQGVFMSKAVPGNDSAFIFEHIQNAIQSVWNYGLQNIMPIKNDGIVYCNKISYNGDKINIGQAVDSDTLHIGRTRETSYIYFIGCHGDILLFNRTLTEYEISWVKNNMMCSKQQEPDIDL